MIFYAEIPRPPKKKELGIFSCCYTMIVKEM